MELTRRDALVAAAGGGVGLSGGAFLTTLRADSAGRRSVSPLTPGGKGEGVSEPASESRSDMRGTQATFVAVARAIYPDAIDGIEAFVRTYVERRFDGIESERDRDGVKAAVRDLDGLAAGWHDASIADLDPGTVGELLGEVGVDSAVPDPSGTIAQRVRYHVVNELQYALYASPTGGRLVGIENPIGYPGGIESYRQGPSS